MARARIAAFPTFDSSRLESICAAFAKRGKALRYRLDKLVVAREVESPRCERLNVDARYRRGTQIRLSVWDDGRMWFLVVEAGASRSGGWRFHLAFNGTSSQLAPKEVEAAFEDGLVWLSHDDPERRAAALIRVWSHVEPQVEVLTSQKV
jgi:hypothetical protein